MAKYPWFWGPINGLKDVEYMLSVTLDVYMKSRWLPDYTKGLAAGNISEAMNWVREQRARQAATSGGEPVAH
ncbi:hypothetical protein [Streptomyces sp. NPDC087297]|uniref:hypothetical protein n=1 Tax=Streptomyces sp. NPDC087297 TaxID=3365778 RepID=UPI0037F2B1F4